MLLVLQVPSVFLVWRLASASTGEKEMHGSLRDFSVCGTRKAFNFCGSLIPEVLPQLLSAKFVLRAGRSRVAV